MKNSILMTYFAPTIAECLKVEKPHEAKEGVGAVKNLLEKNDCLDIDRTLIYNPDAIGMWLFQKYTDEFSKVLENTQLALPVQTVLPSVTPVCFGTMYTGAMPSTHGIMRYEKRIIETDSLFDRLAEAGKKVAIVAVENSSMAIIFGKRKVDYYILPYDEEVNQKAKELIKEDNYDVIVVYNQEYDDKMHATYPESEVALQAMKNQINAFSELADAVRENWTNHNALICCVTDHGIHTGDNGKGTHGYAVEEDLNVMHFFGVLPKNK